MTQLLCSYSYDRLSSAILGPEEGVSHSTGEDRYCPSVVRLGGLSGRVAEDRPRARPAAPRRCGGCNSRRRKRTSTWCRTGRPSSSTTPCGVAPAKSSLGWSAPAGAVAVLTCIGCPPSGTSGSVAPRGAARGCPGRTRSQRRSHSPDAFLFRSQRQRTEGKPQSYSAWRRRFNAALTVAGLTGVTPHDLHATHGSWVVDTHGVLVAVHRLGHSNASVTARHYARAVEVARYLDRACRACDGNERARSGHANQDDHME
jgi:hypothetical protein